MADKRIDAIDEAALHWFVRRRAGNFSAAERHQFDDWMASDPAHQAAFATLESTWARLDEIATLVPRPVVASRRHTNPLLPLGGALLAAAAFAVFFLLPREDVQRTVEAAPGQHRQITFADGTYLALDADSVARVNDTLPPRIELLKGSIYLDVSTASSGQLQVHVGKTRIRDIGTRFSVSFRSDLGQVSVADGQVELQDDKHTVTLFPGHGANFGPQGIASEYTVASDDIAPWRNGQWRFAATPLTELVDELARQQRIRLDIPDTTIAALTVSGNFPISQPDRVLWAITQVHGLKLDRITERHYRLHKD